MATTESPAGPQPHGGAAEAAAAEEKAARAAAAEEEALAVAAAEAAAEAEQVRAAAEEKRRAATAAALRARPYNEKIAKAARLAGTERPCIGLCAQVVQRPPTTPEGLIDDDISGCRLVPFDVTAYASYIGAPMQQWPGLAAVCKLALVERLPPCWREVDPRASKVPGYHEGEEGRAAYAALGGSKLVFFNRETGCARVQHPRDAFYRQLILLLLRENDNPFTREVMHFNVVGNADSKKDFFFDFRSNKTVSLDEALAEAEESTVSYAGGVTRASTLSDDLTTRRLLRELSPRVEAQAARTIWGAFRHWKAVGTWRFLAKIGVIRRNVLLRKLQLAVRRFLLRRKLVAWDAAIRRRAYFARWWELALSRPEFATTLRMAMARRLVSEAAQAQPGHDCGVQLRGKSAFAAPASVQTHLDTMKVKLAQMEALLG